MPATNHRLRLHVVHHRRGHSRAAISTATHRTGRSQFRQPLPRPCQLADDRLVSAMQTAGEDHTRGSAEWRTLGSGHVGGQPLGGTECSKTFQRTGFRQEQRKPCQHAGPTLSGRAFISSILGICCCFCYYCCLSLLLFVYVFVCLLLLFLLSSSSFFLSFLLFLRKKCPCTMNCAQVSIKLKVFLFAWAQQNRFRKL